MQTDESAVKRSEKRRCLHRLGVSVRMARQVTGSGSYEISALRHDQYSAYLVVCQRGGSFSGDVTSTFLNLTPEGGLTQHLEIQQAMLPALFTVSLRVVCIVCVLTYYCSYSCVLSSLKRM